MSASRRIMRHLNILRDDIKLFALLVDHMRNVSEQFVQLSNALLDNPDLGLALND
jgi:hypothetical protein